MISAREAAAIFVVAVVGGLCLVPFVIVNSTSRKERIFRVVGGIIFALGIIGAVGISNYISNILVRSPEPVVQTINNPQFIPIWIIVAIILFFLRGATPKTYGTTEAVVGLTTVFYAMKARYVGITDLPTKLLALASGIYIIVRGLDNFEKGLSPSAKAAWNKVFIKAKALSSQIRPR